MKLSLSSAMRHLVSRSRIADGQAHARISIKSHVAMPSVLSNKTNY